MLLVTGATGNVGRELCRELDGMRQPFRALVRDAARAGSLERDRLFVGDLEKPESLSHAFEDVDAVFLLTQGIGTDLTSNALAAAQTAGVRRIVTVSSINVLGDPMPRMGHWHHEREKLVRASGIPYTILRPGGFMTNALDWANTVRHEGHVLDPVGPGRQAPIDPADVAAVAALALTRDGHEGETYVLTGQESYTVAEQVEILAATLGRDLEVREVATPEEAVRFRFPNGAPAALAQAIVESLNSMRADTVGFRTSEVERLLGRAPRTFADWCARNTAAFAT